MTTPEHDEIRARLGRALPRVHGTMLLRDEWAPGKPLTPAGAALIDAILPEVVALLEEARAEGEDPEQFCDTCFAGLESSEHHEKCVLPAEAAQDEKEPAAGPRRQIRRAQ